MSPIRIQLPEALIRELEAELQGTRRQDSGGFIWYSRNNGDPVYFMPEGSHNIPQQGTESDEQPTRRDADFPDDIFGGTEPYSRW